MPDRARYAQAFVNLGPVLASQSRFPEAIEALQSAVHLEPNNTKALTSQAMVLTRLGQPTEAVIRKGGVPGGETNNTKALTSQAMVLTRLGQPTEAVIRKGGVPGGEIHDLEVQTSTYTPVYAVAFVDLSGYRTRLEILYHSIHYFDPIRSWLGNPLGVYGKEPPHREPRGQKDHRHRNSKRVFVATKLRPSTSAQFCQMGGT